MNFLHNLIPLFIWFLLEPFMIKFYIRCNPFLFRDLFLSEKDKKKLREVLSDEK